MNEPVHKPRRRWWRWLVFSILLVVVLIPVGLVALLGTERGTDWLLRQVSAVLPAETVSVDYGRSEGHLLDRLVLRDLQVVAADTRIRVATLVLDWRPKALIERRLHVQAIELEGLDVALPPPAEPTEPEPVQLPDLQLPIRVQLDRLLLDSAVLRSSQGEATRIERASLTAAADNQGVRIDDLSVRIEGANLAADLSMATTAPHALNGSVQARADASLTGEDIGAVALTADLGGVALQPTFAVIVNKPAELRLKGRARLDKPLPGFDVVATWDHLGWPLSGEPQVSAAQGRLTLEGDTDDYSLTLRGDLEVPGQPLVALTLDAQGDLAGVELKPLIARVGEGKVQARGRVGWKDQVAWQLKIAAEDLNPGLFVTEMPGEVDARIGVDGGLVGKDNSLELTAVIDALSGRLRDYPVSAAGTLRMQGGGLVAEGLKVASGPNRLAVEGRAADTLDLAFSIDAPELVGLYPDLQGSLRGEGKLAGTQQSPAITVQLVGNTLAFQDARLSTLNLDVDWRGERGKGTLTAAGVKAGETELDSAKLQIDGRIDQHRLTLAVQGPDAVLDLAASGGLKQERWQGTLERLLTKAGPLGEWQLRSPAALDLGPTQASVEEICLAQSETALCAQGGWSEKQGLDAQAELSRLDLTRLAEFLPGEAVVEGQLDAQVAVKGPPENPRATFEVRPSDGRIRVEGDEPFELAFRNAAVTGQFVDDVATAELSLLVGSNGQASGRLRIGAAKTGARALDGRIEAGFPDLALVAGFLPALESVKGTLDLAANIGGTLAEPQVDGTLAVADASARVVPAGIELTAMGLRVRSAGRGPVTISGEAHSGEGRIALDGTVDLNATPGPAADLRIRGNDFQAARLPEARVWVSPDLRLEGAQPYRLTGALRIPRAAIELTDLPAGTVDVSDDQVIVGEGETPPGPAVETAGVEVDVRVELGDKVSFKGFGLKTGLTGALRAKSGTKGTTVDGKIELVEASYKAYGQDLTVEQGRLLFAGPPGNPDIDLRAVRESRDGLVKAYLAMSGPLSKPRPRVYTEPAKPEAEAVAYLLTGRGLSDAGAGEGADIASAALSLGMSRSEPLLQNLSDRLGLDDLRIEDGESGLDGSALLLGKYLNPNLYLGYSQGLFNPEGAVVLRLRLGEHVEVESRSGNEQSVDLFYRIEHD